MNGLNPAHEEIPYANCPQNKAHTRKVLTENCSHARWSKLFTIRDSLVNL